MLSTHYKTIGTYHKYVSGQNTTLTTKWGYIGRWRLASWRGTAALPASWRRVYVHTLPANPVVRRLRNECTRPFCVVRKHVIYVWFHSQHCSIRHTNTIHDSLKRNAAIPDLSWPWNEGVVPKRIWMYNHRPAMLVVICKGRESSRNKWRDHCRCKSMEHTHIGVQGWPPYIPDWILDILSLPAVHFCLQLDLQLLYLFRAKYC